MTQRHPALAGRPAPPSPGRSEGRGRRLLARAALAAACLAAAGAPRAQGLTGQVEPSISSSHGAFTDAAGATTHSDSFEWSQRYRLGFERDLYPFLRIGGGGIYDWRQGSTVNDGASTDLDARRWSAFARLAVGGPVLSGALGYDLREQSAEQRGAGFTLRAPDLVHEVASASVSWRPADLPTLDLRLSRTQDYDKARVQGDLTTDEAVLGALYAPLRELELRYSVRYAAAADRIHGTETRDVTYGVRANWSGTFLDRRLSSSVSLNVGGRSASVTASGPGGVVSTRQLPVAGLSAIEAFPATVDRIKLGSNGKLVDGDLASGADLDLGFTPSAGGDRANRHIGAQFPTALLPVNTIHVYVNQPLPPGVWGAIAWEVYQSDDDDSWTRVNKAVPAGGGAPVQFGLFESRFEIAIEETRARYLKVVAAPLLPAVTTDPRYGHVLVTELVFFQSVPASEARGTSFAGSSSLAGTAKWVIWRAPDLTYDFTFFGTHGSNPGVTTYSAVNGLSVSHRVDRTLSLSARVDRTDSDDSGSHSALSRYAASLSFNPLPALGATAVYSGQFGERSTGSSFTNSLSMSGRADLYPGASLGSNFSFGAGTSEAGQSTRIASAGASASVVPNRVVSLTFSYDYAYSSASGGGRPDQRDRAGRVEGNLSLSPFPALFASAGASRFTSGRSPNTLANFSISAAPFPRGDLLLRFSYSDSIDTGSDLRTRSAGPGLRWNIRPGAIFDASYTRGSSHSPAVDTRTSTFFANLVVSLR